jgi:hypothetical protein
MDANALNQGKGVDSKSRRKKVEKVQWILLLTF